MEIEVLPQYPVDPEVRAYVNSLVSAVWFNPLLGGYDCG